MTQPAHIEILGPTISVTDLDEHARLLTEVFGLREVARQDLDESATTTLFGTRGGTARTVVLDTAIDDRPASEAPGPGVRLVRFDPLSANCIRDGARGIDTEALKVIDFMTTDFESACERVRAHGFELAGESHYSVPPEGRFSEAHVEVTDHVVYALLAMHDTPHDEFLRVTDRLFGEVLGFSAPVADRAPVDAFYRSLGLDEVYRYSFESASFEEMIGAGQKATITGVNYATSRRDPMIGIIDYGLPPHTYNSLAQRASFPSRGLGAIRLKVTELDETVSRVSKETGAAVVSSGRVDLAPFGTVETTLLRAPHGILHQIIAPA